MSADGGGWREVPEARGTLCEGARWLPDPGVFQWVDILESRIVRWDPDGAMESRHLDLEFVTVALPIDPDLQLVASRDVVATYRWSTGELRPVASVEVAGDIRFNDGGISPTGDLYVGTMSMEHRPGAAHLYRLADDALTPVLDGIGISNGLAWCTDAEAVYVDSLPARSVSVLEVRDGHVLNQTTVKTFDAPDEPDGLTIGPSGEVIVAIWRGSRLVQLDARSGAVLGELPVPATYPTSVAVGAGLLLVTTADYTEPDVSRGQLDGAVLVRAYEAPA